jgi:GR25 family glycosyltransferase involved in LPS biosynthesis
VSGQGQARATADGVAGIYVNLDRRPDRRKHVEEQLRRFGLEGAYHRLPATDGLSLPKPLYRSAGVVGCFISHMRAIGAAAAVRRPVHIVEDDIVFSRHVAPFLRYLATSRLFDHFDIIFLDMWVDFTTERFAAYNAAYQRSGAGGGKGFDPARIQVLDLRELRIGSNVSYVVSPAKAAMIAQLLREEAVAGPRFAVDSFMDRLCKAGVIRAAVVLPFLTSVHIESGSNSDTTGFDPDVLRLLLLLRQGFFVDRDMDGVVLPGVRALAGARSESLFTSVAETMENAYRRAFD